MESSTFYSDWREARRIRAWELKQQGWTQRKIAEALGVSEGAVSQWMKRAREGGVEALRHRPPPGPRRKLSNEQLAQLPDLLSRRPPAYGFEGGSWTRARVAEVIEREFGVTYDHSHISRLLKQCGWSLKASKR